MELPLLSLFLLYLSLLIVLVLCMVIEARDSVIIKLFVPVEFLVKTRK